MNSVKIFCESRIDFKYRNIFSRISSIETIEGRFFTLLKGAFLNKNSVYHIRYLKYRGVLLTPIRLILVAMACKFSKSRIIWSCHNIYEHNIDSIAYNNWIRLFVGRMSYRIIVFHKELINFFPDKMKPKVSVACFGNMRKDLANQLEPNKDFKKRYEKWNQDYSPNIVSISAAKRNKLKFLIDGVRITEIGTLIIAPGQKAEDTLLNSKNILFYSGFVRKEVNEILDTSSGIIGFIGHDNISVPTSIYMYASFGIPVIALDQPPINTIVNDYKIGIVAKTPRDIQGCFEKIQKDYDYYKYNCALFLKENSWDKSAQIHSKVFT